MGYAEQLQQVSNQLATLIQTSQSKYVVPYMGESVGFCTQTAIFFISAVAAVGLIYQSGKQARIRALLDLMMKQKTDLPLIAATHRVLELKTNGELLSKHAIKDSDERKEILLVLNNLEFIAVGIRLKAFDENVYKESQYSNLIRIWNACSGFVSELRNSTGKKTIFQDLEFLAKKWEAKPIKNINK